MQTQTLENKGEALAPYNDVAELIDREICKKSVPPRDLCYKKNRGDL